MSKNQAEARRIAAVPADRIDQVAGNRRSGSFDLGYFDAVDDAHEGRPYDDGSGNGTCGEYQDGYEAGWGGTP